jgi:hypothetical protein
MFATWTVLGEDILSVVVVVLWMEKRKSKMCYIVEDRGYLVLKGD